MAGRVLLAQTSFLGDVVLTTALARAIVDARPGTEIYWLVRPQAVPLLEPGFGAQRVLAFDKYGEDRGVTGMLRLARTLRALRFDTALAVQRSVRTASLLACARIPLRIGYARSAGAWLHHRTVEQRGTHARDRLVALAAGLGIPVPEQLPLPHLVVDEEASRRVEARLVADGALPGERVVVIAPGSAWATKRWPAARFAEAAARLQQNRSERIVVIGAPEDRELAREIATASSARIIDTVGAASIADAVAWISRARLVLANDSSPAHIAAALGRPVVALFGPTTPEQGFAPLGDQVRVVERTLDCRPCSRHGGDLCPLGTHECLEKLSADRVVDAAHGLLGEG